MKLAKPNKDALTCAQFNQDLTFIIDFLKSTWPEPTSTTSMPPPLELLTTEDWVLWSLCCMVVMALLVTLSWARFRTSFS